jgi:hypothetical protein
MKNSYWDAFGEEKTDGAGSLCNQEIKCTLRVVVGVFLRPTG